MIVSCNVAQAEQTAPSAAAFVLSGASGQVTRKSTLPISLNAIAKGYILDHVAQLAMQQVEVSGVLVDIGGDIRAAGNLVASIAIADPEHDSLGAPD